MDKNATYIASLLKKMLSGANLEPDESLDLQAWLGQDDTHRDLQRQLEDPHFLLDETRRFAARKPGNVWNNEKLLLAMRRDRPQSQYQSRRQDIPRRSTRRWRWYAAASIVVVFLIGIWFVDDQWGDSGIIPDPAHDAENLFSAVSPGGEHAVLRLANGSLVNLPADRSGIVLDGQDIRYGEGGALEWTASLGEEWKNTQMLEITTPKGGTYQLTLPDGSRVWLNAASTLKFPKQFGTEGRMVELRGEGYFDVRKDKVPFRVRSGEQELIVLGTSFNLSAYPEDAVIRTTLVEGQVRVKTAAKGEGPGDLRLSPGEQSQVSRSNLHIGKTQVDVAPFISWKAGRFNFDGKDFDQVMRELGRWYDLDIRYENGIPQKAFYGDAFRDNNLSIILRMLESVEVDYRLEERTLIIINKKKEESPER